jgi:hypothetical protein
MSSQGTILTYRIEVYAETEEEKTMGMIFIIHRENLYRLLYIRKRIKT